MTKHETFTAFMTAVMAYAPLVGVITYFTSQQGIFYSAIFTLFFWLAVSGYFVFDYGKTHKKRRNKTKFPPLITEKIEPKKPILKTSKAKIIISLLFFSLEIFEAFLFLVLSPFFWEVYMINGVAVLTYNNGLLIIFFSFGLFLAVDVTRRLKNPKEIIEIF